MVMFSMNNEILFSFSNHVSKELERNDLMISKRKDKVPLAHALASWSLTEGKHIDSPRVSRGVGGWFNRPKKCFTSSKIQNSKKWSKVCSRVLWNKVTRARS